MDYKKVKKIKAFFGRTGGKHFSKKDILPFIKDLEYDTYIEAFVGAGSIFLGRDKKVKTEIINDYDILVYNLWDGIKCCGNQLKDYKLYFMDKSVFKWYLLKEKQNRRIKKQLNNKIETLKEDLFITRCSRAQDNINVDQTKSSSNSCSCSKTIWNRKIETLKEDLFINKNGRFSDNGSDKPNQKLLNEGCSHLREKQLETKIEEKEDNDVCCSIEKTDKGLKLVKKKYYVRNKKYKGNETKWRIHNPNLCGWNNILNNCDKYQERLKDVNIFQGDYKKMLKFDSPTSLFYFDPPWTKTATGKKGNKCYSSFVELDDFYDSIKDLKGFIMISYNNDEDILKKFKDWYIVEISTTYTQKKAGKKKTIDILIMNFKDGKKIKKN